MLPEFDKSRRIDGLQAFVFEAPCQYDMIIGRDFLAKTGIKLDFKFATMQWLETMVPMKESKHVYQQNYTELIEDEDVLDDDDEYESYNAEILTAKKME